MTVLPIPFGNPATYAGHSGVDFPQGCGTTFRASGSGRVTALTYNDRCGYGIWVYYDAIGRDVGYCHLPSHDACPPRGTEVVEGSALGEVGTTGHSTGCHLHVEVEGAASTPGFWQFFTPDRVVGHSASGKDPVPPAPAPKEIEMAAFIPVQLNHYGSHLLILGPGSFRHLIPSDDTDFQKRLWADDDKWVEMDVPHLEQSLVSAGCEPKIFDVRGGKFGVVDPEKIEWDESTGRPKPGKDGWGPGHVWSRAKQEIANQKRMMRKLGIRV